MRQIVRHSLNLTSLFYDSRSNLKKYFNFGGVKLREYLIFKSGIVKARGFGLIAILEFEMICNKMTKIYTD